MSYSAEVFTTDSPILDHDETWNHLLSNTHHKSIFLTGEWLQANISAYCIRRPYWIIVVKHEEQAVAAGAFQEQDGCIQFLGHEHSDYQDFLLSKNLNGSQAKICIKLLLNTIKQAVPQAKKFDLIHIPETFGTPQLLSQIGSPFYSTPYHYRETPIMNTENAKQHVNKKSLRRYEKKLAKEGNVAFITYTQTEAIMPLLKKYFNQHINRWNANNLESQFLQEENKYFFHKIVENLAPRGWLRFSKIKFEDRIIAFDFSFCYQEQYVLYNSSYDPEYADYSPGTILLCHVFQQALDENTKECDFCLGEEEYKYRFSTSIRKHVNIEISFSLIKALRLRAFLFIKPRLRKILRKLGILHHLKK